MFETAYRQLIIAFFFVGTITLLNSCNDKTPESQPIKNKSKLFSTTDPSKLYFNNIHSIHYYRDRKQGTKLDIYRHKKFSRTNKRPIIYPLIVNNWMEDEAYLFIEENEFPDFNDSLSIRMIATDTVVVSLDLRTKENTFDFCHKIYKEGAGVKQFEVFTNSNTWIPIFENAEDKRLFFITFRDFLGLIEYSRHK